MINKTFLINLSLSSLIVISLFLAIKVSDFSYGYLYYFAAMSPLMGLIGYQLFQSYQKTLSLPKNPYILCLIGFIIWISLSVFWSPIFSSSFSAVTIIYLLPIGVILGFWSNTSQQQNFQTLLIFLLLAIAWKSLQQKFIAPQPQEILGFFSNKNTNGIFISVILISISTQLIQTNKKISPFIYTALLFIGAFIISLTLSRGAILGLTVGLSLLLLHCYLQKISFVPFIKIIASLATGYFSAISFSSTQNLQQFTHTTLTTNVTAIANGRTALWQSGWEMYLDRPLLGWGFNMFNWLFPQYRHAPDQGMYVHNDYFQFLIELGPIGCLLFSGFLVLFLLASKRIYTLLTHTNDKLTMMGLTAACLALFTHSFFTFNLYQAAPLLIIGLYVGIITQTLNQIETKNNLSLQFSQYQYATKTSYYGILITVSLLIGLVIFLHVFSLKKTSATYDNSLIFLQESNKAYALMNYEEPILATQLKVYIDLLNNETNYANLSTRNYLLTNGLMVSREAINKNPYRPSNYINTAKLYVLSDNKNYPQRTHKINEAYSNAIRVDPFDLKTRFDYANYLIKQQQQVKAIEIFKGAFELRHYGFYNNAAYYLQSFYKLLSTQANQEVAMAHVKQQIDTLTLKTARHGYYTFHAW